MAINVSRLAPYIAGGYSSNRDREDQLKRDYYHFREVVRTKPQFSQRFIESNHELYKVLFIKYVLERDKDKKDDLATVLYELRKDVLNFCSAQLNNPEEKA